MGAWTMFWETRKTKGTEKREAFSVFLAWKIANFNNLIFSIYNRKLLATGIIEQLSLTEIWNLHF